MSERRRIHLIAQKGSPLGTKRHVIVAERRMRLGQPGAYAVGPFRYLTPEALEEELAAPPPPPAAHTGRLDTIQREIVGQRFLGKVH